MATPGSPLHPMAQLGNELRQKLFIVVSGIPYEYTLRDPKDADLARDTWAVHGVCPSCNRCTISDGHCVQCGALYRLYPHATTDVEHQKKLAQDFLEGIA